jgi:hypothetical protein
MKAFLDFLVALLPSLSPVLVSVLVYPTMQLLKALFNRLDQSRAWVKQLLVGLLSLGAAKAAALWGITIPLAADQVTNEAVTGILGAIIAMLLHIAQRRTKT